MTISDWTKEQDWEILFLNGEFVPGVARVEAKMDAGLDFKKARKQKKARLTDEGEHPVELEITIELMPGPQMADFEARIVPLLRPRSRTDERPKISIEHPTARLWGVSVVMVGDVRSPHPDPGGTLCVKFKAVEYREPEKIKAKPSAKPSAHEGDDDWNVQPEIDEISPGKSGASAQNFIGPDDQPLISGTNEPYTPDLP